MQRNQFSSILRFGRIYNLLRASLLASLGILVLVTLNTLKKSYQSCQYPCCHLCVCQDLGRTACWALCALTEFGCKSASFSGALPYSPTLHQLGSTLPPPPAIVLLYHHRATNMLGKNKQKKNKKRAQLLSKHNRSNQGCNYLLSEGYADT